MSSRPARHDRRPSPTATRLTAAILMALAVPLAASSATGGHDDATATPAPSTFAVPSTPADTTTTTTAGPSPASTVETTSPPSTPAGFAVTAERRQELEDAGLGWMLDVTYPTQPEGVPWPTEAWPTGPLPDGVDRAAVQAIVDEAFRPIDVADGDDAGRVDALLAVSGGRLVLEAYNGWDPAAPHVSWSMAKSVTHALLGILVADGRLDPFAPAPVPEWSDPADPRHGITIDTLLHMRSGLTWQEEYAGQSDVITMLFGEGRADRGRYAASKPLQAAPDTTFAYSTGTSMILARIIADVVGYGDAGTAWADDVLFEPLGITTVVHDLDDAGAISGGSAIDMSAQDFARFGLLYLRGGEWDGRQIVPTEWIDDGRLPRADEPSYGAHWWIDDRLPPPHIAFMADGFAGQLIVIVPTLDLVVVALADVQDGRSDAAAHALVDAFASAAAIPPDRQP